MQKKCVASFVFLGLLFLSPIQAQEKVRINDRIEVSRETPAEGITPPELKGEFLEFFKAFEQELKAQAGNFNRECQWLIIVKLVIKPKFKVIELTLDPKGTLSPRIMTTGFIRKADFDSEEGFKESFKSLVKLVINRTANC